MHKIRLGFMLFLISAQIEASPNLQAQPKTVTMKQYLRVYSGSNVGRDVGFAYHYEGDSAIDFGRTPTFGVELFIKNVENRLGFSADYTFTGFSEHFTNHDFFYPRTSRVDLTIFSNFINLYYYPKVDSRHVEPFVGAGVGVARLSIEDSGHWHRQKESTEFGFQGIAGMRLTFNERFGLSFFYKYTNLDGPLDRIHLHRTLLGLDFYLFKVQFDA